MNNRVPSDVPKLWYERSLRQGNISSAAVGIISFSELDFAIYCLTRRAFDESKPGRLAMCANNELLLARSADLLSLQKSLLKGEVIAIQGDSIFFLFICCD